MAEKAKINQQLATRRSRLRALAVRARANRQKTLQTHKRKMLAMQRFQLNRPEASKTRMADSLMQGGSDSSTYSEEDEAVIAIRGLRTTDDRRNSHSDLLRRVFANSNVDRLRNMASRNAGISINNAAVDTATAITNGNHSDSSTMSTDDEDGGNAWT